ncbi:hypothetical protein TNCV_2481371 [Trichonephila clavipes]|nr:hypothetical protein TNCV_2481371 [Trichonephila clavipes]
MLTPEVRRFKRGVPSSLEENPDKKRRPSNRNNHKRRLPSSTSLKQQAKKRGRRTEENNKRTDQEGRGSRLHKGIVQVKEEPVRSRRSSPYNLRHRLQSRQDGQNPEKSLRSGRSTSLEVHIGDIAERK